MTPPMVIRGRAVEACVERFNGRAMDWGKVDCARIALHNLHGLGIKVPYAKGLDYASERGALKALKALGFAGLGEALDAVPDLFRIPPAFATQGDIVGMGCEGDVWDMALTIKAPNGRLFGILEGIAQPMRPDMTGAIAAWRCNPCLK